MEENRFCTAFASFSPASCTYLVETWLDVERPCTHVHIENTHFLPSFSPPPPPHDVLIARKGQSGTFATFSGALAKVRMVTTLEWDVMRAAIRQTVTKVLRKLFFMLPSLTW